MTETLLEDPHSQIIIVLIHVRGYCQLKLVISNNSVLKLAVSILI